MEQKLSTPLQHVWLVKLAEYDFNIQYKKSVDNLVTSALSRLLENQTKLNAISTISTNLYHQIQESWQADSHL